MSDYETAQRRRNIIVGVFVIVALCALVWLISIFDKLPVWVTERKSFAVKVRFATAPGVAPGTAVRFCGYPVGKVIHIDPPKVLEDLKMPERFYHQTVVVLGIKNDFNDIPANVDVKLMMQGLGSSYIEFKVRPPDPNQVPSGVLADGDELQGSTGMTSEFFPEESQKKLKQLVDGLRTFINNANDIIGDPNNKQNFKAILANLRDASEQATRTFEKFGKLAEDGSKFLTDPNAPIKKALAAVEETLAGANNTLAGADKTLTDLGKPIEELGEGLAELRVILEKINEGEGTAAKFINDAKFYDNLVENTEVLQGLLKDLRSIVADVNDKGLRSVW